MFCGRVRVWPRNTLLFGFLLALCGRGENILSSSMETREQPCPNFREEVEGKSVRAADVVPSSPFILTSCRGSREREVLGFTPPNDKNRTSVVIRLLQAVPLSGKNRRPIPIRTQYPVPQR